MKSFFGGVVIVWLFGCGAFAVGTYDGGDGTAGDPFQIRTAGQLNEVSMHSEDWDKCFVLTADIDLTGISIIPIGINSVYEFTGTFDGGGHVISNLTLEGYTSFTGLFGLLELGSEVKNLGLENVNISTNINAWSCLGGLVGRNWGGTVSQCYVTGEVSASQLNSNYCGGLIGQNGGWVQNCYSRATVTGYDYAGGLIGVFDGGEISRCYSSGLVNGNEQNNGGLVGGYLDVRYLISSFYDSTVNPELNASDVYHGRATYEMQNMAMYRFNGWGGDVWTLDAGNDYPRLAWEEAGGVAISDPVGDGSLDNPYEISTAYELAEIGHHSEFSQKSFLIKSDIDMDPDVTGIPIFRKCLIGDTSTLFSGYNGCFDGDGHVISNLVIESIEPTVPLPILGLFGIVYYGTIKNLGVENISVDGYSSITGGLAGHVYLGEISQCYCTGSVKGDLDSYTGGLVGINHNSLIRDCYSSCSVSDGDYSGGMIGYGYGGEIRNCYAAGSVSGGNAGGLTGGDSEGIYSNCIWDNTFNAGLSDCGHDIDANIYNADLASVEGVSTGDLQTVNTFTDVSWDFVGESDNGELDFWRLCVDGSGYPRLAWEFSQHGDFVCGDGVDLDDYAYFSARYLCDGCGGIFDSRVGIPDSISGTVDLQLFAKISECWLRPLHEDCFMAEISGDTVINSDDLHLLAEQWLCSSPVNWDRADLDGDGAVNDFDFDLWVGYWLGD